MSPRPSLAEIFSGSSRPARPSLASIFGVEEEPEWVRRGLFEVNTKTGEKRFVATMAGGEPTVKVDLPTGLAVEEKPPTKRPSLASIFGEEEPAPGMAGAREQPEYLGIVNTKTRQPRLVPGGLATNAIDPETGLIRSESRPPSSLANIAAQNVVAIGALPIQAAEWLAKEDPPPSKDESLSKKIAYTARQGFLRNNPLFSGLRLTGEALERSPLKGIGADLGTLAATMRSERLEAGRPEDWWKNALRESVEEAPDLALGLGKLGIEGAQAAARLAARESLSEAAFRGLADFGAEAAGKHPLGFTLPHEADVAGYMTNVDDINSALREAEDRLSRQIAAKQAVAAGPHGLDLVPERLLGENVAATAEQMRRTQQEAEKARQAFPWMPERAVTGGDVPVEDLIRQRADVRQSAEELRSRLDADWRQRFDMNPPTPETPAVTRSAEAAAAEAAPLPVGNPLAPRTSLGVVGPDMGIVDVLAEAAPQWKRVLRKYMTSGGEYSPLRGLGSFTAGRVGQSSHEIARHEAIAGQNLRDFKTAWESFTKDLKKNGVNRNEDELLRYVSDGLEGKNDLSEVPENVRTTVGKMRTHLDELTGGLLDNVKLSDGMRAILEENRGEYARRTFEVHRNRSEWEKIVKGRERWRWDNMEAFLKNEKPDLTPDEIDGYMNSMLRGEGDAFAHAGPRTSALQMDPKIFKTRQQMHMVHVEGGESRSYRTAQEAETAAESVREAGGKATVTKETGMPDPVEQFLGIHHDPTPRYSESVARMAHDVETAKSLNDIKAMGEGKTFFSKPTGEFSRRIGGNDLNPLKDMYTTPEMADVIQAMSNPTRLGPTWLAKTAALGRVVKTGKTAYSPITQVGNLLSWSGIWGANGHFQSMVNIPEWGHTAKVLIGGAKLSENGRTMRAIERVADAIETVGGKRLSDAVRWDLPSLRAEYQEAVRRGIVGEGPRGAEMARALGLVSETQGAQKLGGLIERVPGGKAVTWLGKKAASGAKQIYAGSDDFGKFVAWRAEKANYKKAMPELSEDALNELTAGIVRDTTPTYSKLSPGIKALRDFPFLADFPAFHAEVLRTGKNIFFQAKAEMKSANPLVQKIGRKRMAGFLGAAIAPQAAMAAARHRAGVSAEEQDAIRESLPPWNRNSDFVVLEKKAPGEYSIANISSAYPYSIFHEPVNAMLASGSADARAWDAIVEATDPFARESMLASAYNDISRNRTQDGRPIWPETATKAEKMEAIALHLARRLEPGGLALGREIKYGITGKENPKTGRTVDLEKVAASLVTGTRPIEVNTPRQLGFAAGKLKRSRQDIMYFYNREGKRKGITPEEQTAQQVKANDRWRRSLEEMRDMVRAAKVQGMSDDQIMSILEENKIGSDPLDFMFGGPVPRIDFEE